MSTPTRFLSLIVTAVLCATEALCAGIVVTHTDKGFQFGDAVSLNVNGKDKVLNLGANSKIEDPTAKLASIKLGETLYRDQATGFFALSSEGSIHYVLPEGNPKGTELAWAMWGNARIRLKAPTRLKQKFRLRRLWPLRPAASKNWQN